MGLSIVPQKTDLLTVLEVLYHNEFLLHFLLKKLYLTNIFYENTTVCE